MALSTTMTTTTEYPVVPWPNRLPFSEPQWLKDMPGGLLAAFTLLTVILSVVYFICLLIYRFFVELAEKRRWDLEFGAARSRGSSEDVENPNKPRHILKDCIGPKIAIVLERDQTGCCESLCCPFLKGAKDASLNEKLTTCLKEFVDMTATKLQYDKTSALQKYDVWVVGMKFADVDEAAEVQHLKKVVDPNYIRDLIAEECSEKPPQQGPVESTSPRGQEKPTGTYASHLKRTRSSFLQQHIEKNSQRRTFKNSCNRFTTWMRYTGRTKIFLNWNKQEELFSNHDILQVMSTKLAHAKAHDDVPVFLAAKEAGVIVAMMPILDRQEDISKMQAMYKEWKIWQPPPAGEMSENMTPGEALYYIFIYSYARWLLCPAVMIACSLAWHGWASKYGFTYGAAFNEGWSQALFAVVLSCWSTIFLASWRRKINETMQALGQGELEDSSAHFDYTSIFFKSNGFTVTKNGVKEHFKRHNDSSLLRTIGFVLAVGFLVSSTCYVVFLLCQISDKVSLWHYSDNSMLNTCLQNIESIFVYFVFCVPLAIVYDKIIIFLVRSESIYSPSTLTEKLVCRRAYFNIANSMGWFLYLGLFTFRWKLLQAQLRLFFIVKPSGLGGAAYEAVCAWFTQRKNRKQQKRLLEREESEEKEDKRGPKIEEIVEKEFTKDECDVDTKYTQIMIIYAAANLFAPLYPEGMIFAFVHALFQYYSHAVTLQYSTRLSLPNEKSLYSLNGWVYVFECIGWASIFTSSWLVYVFLQGLGNNEPHWDKHVRWDPTVPANSTSPGLMQPVLGMFPKGQHTVFMIIFLEHMLFLFKAYLTSSISNKSAETKRHHDLVKQMFKEAALTRKPDVSATAGLRRYASC
eukprot:TRINITY_DN1247_c0_g1_i1.p1 TRINITY_DN1247_c0_g1~~TRINITY_DN1247_c0_g1_i1.p1  ORF type:complete len:876 (-),score=139.33 TRINITY_DN1247_c0_g1_i1:47-2623(-)